MCADSAARRLYAVLTGICALGWLTILLVRRIPGTQARIIMLAWINGQFMSSWQPLASTSMRGLRATVAYLGVDVSASLALTTASQAAHCG